MINNCSGSRYQGVERVESIMIAINIFFFGRGPRPRHCTTLAPFSTFNVALFGSSAPGGLPLECDRCVSACVCVCVCVCWGRECGKMLAAELFDHRLTCSRWPLLVYPSSIFPSLGSRHTCSWFLYTRTFDQKRHSHVLLLFLFKSPKTSYFFFLSSFHFPNRKDCFFSPVES